MRRPLVACLTVAGLLSAAPAIATTYTDESAFNAAAGPNAVDNFDSYPSSNFVPLSVDPLVGVTFDRLSDGVHYPTIENTSVGGFSHSGVQILGNNDANKLPADGDATIRPFAGTYMTAIGYWNVGGDDRTTLSAFDATGRLIESITTPPVANNLSFQGIVSTTRIASATISEFSGNGWWTIDDLHVATAVPEPTSLALLGAGALWLALRTFQRRS